MKRSDIDAMREWFERYSASFVSDDREVRDNMALKRNHTHVVCRYMLRLAEYESLGENDALMAEAVALLHDVGRFPQYFEYRTFQDRKSVNHGELGARIIRERGVLDNITPDERGLILDAVKYHNTFKLPDLEDKRKVFFIKLIRDADKLDIWNLFLSYMKTPPGERSDDIGLNLPDTSGYSEEVLGALRNGRVVPISSLRSLNDLTLMLLSWMYDLNFRGSYSLLAEEDYLNRLGKELPEDGEIDFALAPLRDFVGSRLKG
jgi:putative nucleotidyltransferase with HDIG domain